MILAIVGPTGVGKTKLSIALAKYYKAIIINADAMQMYQEMNIGTAKIKEEEKEGVPHYLLGKVSIKDSYTVYDYQKDARKIINENKDKNIILVGGTGLYLKAALYNYVFNEEEVNHNNYEGYTNEELYNLALKKDKNLKIHQNNRQRLIRFLNKDNLDTYECYPMYDFKVIGLTTAREILYERINNRVDVMFKDGLVAEAKNLYEANPNSKALATAIGYKELIKYFNNEISLEEAQELIKKNSRHYAKRQYTWFNNQMNVKWFDVNFDNFDITIKEVIKYLEK